MITPPYLKPGDRIGIVSPAKTIDPVFVENAVKMIEKLGYETLPGKYVLGQHNYFAGTDEERTTDFQQMMDDDSVRMILCSRGGYGSARVIDLLDFRKFMAKPKWIAGFSDITVFHAHVFALFGIESLHAAMPLYFPENGKPNKPVEMLFKAASGEKPEYEVTAHKLNRPGFARAPVVGGNLSILTSLLGSRSDMSTAGRILFIEEVGESLYRLDRSMTTLRRAGKLDELEGLLVGGLTVMEDSNVSFGKTAKEIVAEAVSKYEYPLCFDFPAGHMEENYPVIHGRMAEFCVTEEKVHLKFE